MLHGGLAKVFWGPLTVCTTLKGRETAGARGHPTSNWRSHPGLVSEV